MTIQLVNPSVIRAQKKEPPPIINGSAPAPKETATAQPISTTPTDIIPKRAVADLSAAQKRKHAARLEQYNKALSNVERIVSVAQAIRRGEVSPERASDRVEFSGLNLAGSLAAQARALAVSGDIEGYRRSETARLQGYIEAEKTGFSIRQPERSDRAVKQTLAQQGLLQPEAIDAPLSTVRTKTGAIKTTYLKSDTIRQKEAYTKAEARIIAHAANPSNLEPSKISPETKIARANRFLEAHIGGQVLRYKSEKAVIRGENVTSLKSSGLWSAGAAATFAAFGYKPASQKIFEAGTSPLIYKQEYGGISYNELRNAGRSIDANISRVDRNILSGAPLKKASPLKSFLTGAFNFVADPIQGAYISFKARPFPKKEVDISGIATGRTYFTIQGKRYYQDTPQYKTEFQRRQDIITQSGLRKEFTIFQTTAQFAPLFVLPPAKYATSIFTVTGVKRAIQGFKASNYEEVGSASVEAVIGIAGLKAVGRKAGFFKLTDKLSPYSIKAEETTFLEPKRGLIKGYTADVVTKRGKAEILSQQGLPLGKTPYRKGYTLLLKDFPSQYASPKTQLGLGGKNLVIAHVSPGKVSMPFGKTKIVYREGMASGERLAAGGSELGFFSAPPEIGSGKPQAYSYYAGLEGSAAEVLSGKVKLQLFKTNPEILLSETKISKVEAPLVSRIKRGETGFKLYKDIAEAQDIPGRTSPGAGALANLRQEYETTTAINSILVRRPQTLRGRVGKFFNLNIGDRYVRLPTGDKFELKNVAIRAAEKTFGKTKGSGEFIKEFDISSEYKPRYSLAPRISRLSSAASSRSFSKFIVSTQPSYGSGRSSSFNVRYSPSLKSYNSYASEVSKAYDSSAKVSSGRSSQSIIRSSSGRSMSYSSKALSSIASSMSGMSGASSRGYSSRALSSMSYLFGSSKTPPPIIPSSKPAFRRRRRPLKGAYAWERMFRYLRPGEFSGLKALRLPLGKLFPKTNMMR